MTNEEGWKDVAFNSRDPVYLQVVRLFMEKLVTGRLAAGQVIPSRRELASLLKINPNTAQKAYKEMEERRLIVTEGNAPSRVTEDAGVLRGIRAALVEEAADEFIAAVRRIGMPADELIELVRRKYDERQGGGAHD
ncbi:GntR family transcriptional regulator [Paenibacillus sp. IB182496]|uniref:GntR family transcriptional regulator n=1 Tax=Paenibacillus sabuli TaxID=2772509 RepID=A0A927GPW0_9BACL|nr:GntR family transcriptional regulator [Paenibacillus sabuli]MBD2843884.1 GntR family transcriptional regulator [Paenibacillus sabuli]